MGRDVVAANEPSLSRKCLVCPGQIDRNHRNARVGRQKTDPPTTASEVTGFAAAPLRKNDEGLSLTEMFQRLTDGSGVLLVPTEREGIKASDEPGKERDAEEERACHEMKLPWTGHAEDRRIEVAHMVTGQDESAFPWNIFLARDPEPEEEFEQRNCRNL